MAVFKKLVLFTATTLVAVFLILWSLDTFGFHSPISAFLVNWLPLSWIALVSQSVDFALPSSYYTAKTFERTGQVYERLGIRLFKRLVRRGPLSIFSPTLRFPKDKTISALRHLDHNMQQAETVHVVIFMVILGLIIYPLLRGWFDVVGWLLAFNIIINAYPVMLQRYNRIKLHELIQRTAQT